MTLPNELIPLVGEKCWHEPEHHPMWGNDCSCCDCSNRQRSSTGEPFCNGYTISQSRVDALVALVRIVRLGNDGGWHDIHANGCKCPCDLGPWDHQREQFRGILATLTNQEDATP